MKYVALAFLAITLFVCGMCVQGVRDDIKTRDWINPANITVVPNPFLSDQERQARREAPVGRSQTQR